MHTLIVLLLMFSTVCFAAACVIYKSPPQVLIAAGLCAWVLTDLIPQLH